MQLYRAGPSSSATLSDLLGNLLKMQWSALAHQDLWGWKPGIHIYNKFPR